MSEEPRDREPGPEEPQGPDPAGGLPDPEPAADATPEEQGEHVYDLYRRGSELLEKGDFAAAAIPLEQARAYEPDKTSIREALGRAYFRSGRYAAARDEFAAVVERSPVNDFAHFCLGRALQMTGKRTEAKRHLTLAASLRPDRKDYREYLNRIRAA